MKVKTNNANFPAWKEVTTMAKVPAKLEKLQVLARNLWWVWNDEATELFKEIDGAAWDEAGRNPVLFFEKVSIETLEKVEKDSALIKKIDSVYKKFDEYVSAKPKADKPTVAYFSMEYGLTDVVKIYSGDSLPEKQIYEQELRITNRQYVARSESFTDKLKPSWLNCVNYFRFTEKELGSSFWAGCWYLWA